MQWGCSFGLLVAALFPFEAPAFSASEVLKGFSVRSCSIESCIYLEAKEAQRGLLDSIYVFDKAEVRVTGAGSKAKVVETSDSYYVGTSGYFDPIFKRVVLRGVDSPLGDEVVLTLSKEVKVTFFGQ